MVNVQKHVILLVLRPWWRDRNPTWHFKKAVEDSATYSLVFILQRINHEISCLLCASWTFASGVTRLGIRLSPQIDGSENWCSHLPPFAIGSIEERFPFGIASTTSFESNCNGHSWLWRSWTSLHWRLPKLFEHCTSSLVGSCPVFPWLLLKT